MYKIIILKNEKEKKIFLKIANVCINNNVETYFF